MLVASLAWTMLGPQTGWPRLMSVALEAGTLVLAVARAGGSVRLKRLAAAVMALMLAATLGSLAAGATSGFAPLAEAGVVVTAGLAIFGGLARQLTITVQSIMGALCVYLLLGIFFANVDQAVDAFGVPPYFASQPAAGRSDFVYFSFMTLTTTGYGDFVPARSLGRLLAITEALLGQIYLVSVVALIVSNVGRTRPRRR